MPIKLIPPRPGFSPYYYARGSHLGCFVDRSTKSAEERVAKEQIEIWCKQIKRGEYADPRATVKDDTDSFLAAAEAYIKSGGERAYMQPIVKLWRDKKLIDITQVLIDTAAVEIYPNATAATRNRQFYTPVSAILKRAGIERAIKRPKGWKGKKSTSWLEPEQAFALFDAAYAIDVEFGIFLETLCYTGMRLGEALKIKLRELNISKGTIYLPETKNGAARIVHLPPYLVTQLASHPRKLDRDGTERLFRFHASGPFREKLKTAMTKAGLSFPRRQGGFHIFCHTYGTWMKRYGRLDTYGLTRTGRWLGAESAERYNHTEAGWEARQANELPVPKRSGGTG